MSELELKFRIPAGRREALLKAVGRRELERVELDARYFDTADFLLAGHLFALRLRRENGRWVQTLKAARPHSVERLEHEVELPEDVDASGAMPELSRHDGTEVGDALRKLLGHAGRPALVETYRAEIVRQRKLLPYGEALIEWALDEGRIVAGGRQHAVCELELELKDGDTQALYAMARDWQARHGLWIDVVSKAHRGTLLARQREFAAPAKSERPHIERGLSGDAMMRAIVAACLAQVLANVGEIAAGSDAPEHVHQARVGLRRLRTALGELEAFAPGLGESVEPGIAPVFEALGQVRDKTVAEQQLAALLERAGAPLTHTSQAVPELGPLVRATEFQSALLALLAYAQDKPGAADAGKPLGHVRKRLDRLHHELALAAKSFDELPFDDRHRARKRLKRLRYLAGFVAPLFKPAHVDAWIKAAGVAQDALGAAIDREFAARRFEAEAAHDGRAWFAVGWLRAQTLADEHAGRKALSRLVRADVFW